MFRVLVAALYAHAAVALWARPAGDVVDGGEAAAGAPMAEAGASIWLPLKTKAYEPDGTSLQPEGGDQKAAAKAPPDTIGVSLKHLMESLGDHGEQAPPPSDTVEVLKTGADPDAGTNKASVKSAPTSKPASKSQKVSWPLTDRTGPSGESATGEFKNTAAKPTASTEASDQSAMIGESKNMAAKPTASIEASGQSATGDSKNTAAKLTLSADDGAFMNRDQSLSAPPAGTKLSVVTVDSPSGNVMNAEAPVANDAGSNPGRDVISGIYYINLDGRPDRMEHMESQIRETAPSLHTERFSAIKTTAEAAKVDQKLSWLLPATLADDMAALEEKVRGFTLSVKLSHMAVWHQVAQLNQPNKNFIVFEDDVTMRDGWKARVESGLRHVREYDPDWEIVRVDTWYNVMSKDMIWSDGDLSVYKAQTTSDWTHMNTDGVDGKDTIYYYGAHAVVVNTNTVNSLFHKMRNARVADVDALMVDTGDQGIKGLRSYVIVADSLTVGNEISNSGDHPAPQEGESGEEGGTTYANMRMLMEMHR